MKEKTIIRRAIQVLKRLGWCRGVAFRKNGKQIPENEWRNADSCCAIGALYAAKAECHYGGKDLQAAQNLVEKHLIQTGRTQILWHYNDSLAHSKQDIINLFKETLNAN